MGTRACRSVPSGSLWWRAGQGTGRLDRRIGCNQRVKYGPGLQPAPSRTGGDDGLQCLTDLAKLHDLAPHLLELGDRLLAHRRTIGDRIGPQSDQLLDLAQGEPELLRLPDETDALYGLARIDPDAPSRGRRRLLDQTAPLTEAHRLDPATCLSGRFTDRHPSH